MIRGLTAVALLAISATLTAPRANAQFTSACGGVDFFSCVNLAVSGQGTAQLMFTVTNVSNVASNTASEFDQIGIGSVGYSSTAPVITTTGTLATARFTAGTGNPMTFNGAGFTANNLFELDANSPSPKNGLHDGESASFFLTFTSSAYASDFLDGIQLAIHDQKGQEGCSDSNKVVFNADGNPTSASSSPKCGTPPTNTVPEPGSMALLGTGLVGLVPIIRRRRK